MRITVTGGAGFIGWHLASKLVSEGHQVTTVDKLPLPVPIEGLHRHIPSKLDANGPWAVFEDKPDAIVHLAAEAGVYTSPIAAMEQNTLVVAQILDRCPDTTKFVFASSGAIYSLPQDRWNHNRPDAAPHRSAYGISKGASEELIRLYHQQKGIRYTITRFGNIFGHQWKPKAVVGRFLKCALEGHRPVIHGDGTQTRDFTYVGDVVDALAAATVEGDHDTVDISRGVSLSVSLLWDTVAAAVEEEFDIIVPEATFDASSPAGALISRLEPNKDGLITWQPEVDLKDGLRLIIKDILHHQLAGTEVNSVWLEKYSGESPIEIQGVLK